MDTTVTDPLIGASLEGRYRVTERIATGGMATVYRAVDERLDRVVAVKIIRRAEAGDAGFTARFEREAKIIARLSHPNVVGVYDTGSHDGLPYLVMEYVNGKTLRDVLNEHSRLPVRHSLRIAARILDALSAAHRVGLVHRDVKPENVLLAESGAVKVADFGLARIVQGPDADDEHGGQLLATVAYVPPELVAEGVADARSDVYSAGILLFELLTGVVPYDGDDPAEVAGRHVSEDVPPPSEFAEDIPPELDALVVAATRRDRAARPADATEFAARLALVPEPAAAPAARRPERTTTVLPTEPVVRGRSTPAVPPPPPEESGPRFPKLTRRTLLAVGAVAVIMLLVGALGWWFSAGRYERTPSLLDLVATDAESLAAEKGFTVSWAPGGYSENVPKGFVLAQDPAPGEKILDGEPISVTLSLGPERYTITQDIVGMDGAAAKAKLESMNLVVTLQQQFSDTVPAGKVISVTPAPGTEVKRDTPVVLAVSEGPAPVKVPPVVGMQLELAKSTLEGLGLVPVVVEQYHDQVPAGEVFAQDPPVDTGVGAGSAVTITVSKGAEPIMLPNVVGKSFDEARGELQRLGFKVERFDLPLGNDEVWDMSPDGDTMQPKGSSVTLYTY
ncbi:serine/threonine protein kinase [Actinorhabdospora filicis]|uniref:non-specific serine/threonine protein kinase n=1 Tax=Actinorhabdospora filicis TaxID=1785913 RepID=A0A9W6SN89_9ACTN|nr:Stk1 family PASTA domain-containing Ser/Thr kinase [Actinorhabdospora filicis]GLZ79002.1 serine/threonine protein kinase [Actinorhabdospora filicis]